MRYENQTLSGRHELDGNEFLNVRFERAFLTYGGGAVTLSEVKFDNVTFGFHSNATATLQLLRYVREQTNDGRRAVESLLDGTAEIGDGPPHAEIAALRPVFGGSKAE